MYWLACVSGFPQKLLRFSDREFSHVGLISGVNDIHLHGVCEITV
jgi:hypothetical protein